MIFVFSFSFPAMITKRSTTQSLEDRGPRYSRHQGVLWMLVCKDCRGITICAWHLDDADDDDDETTAMISVLILTIHGWHYWHYISNEFAIYFYCGDLDASGNADCFLYVGGPERPIEEVTPGYRVVSNLWDLVCSFNLPLSCWNIPSGF